MAEWKLNAAVAWTSEFEPTINRLHLNAEEWLEFKNAVNLIMDFSRKYLNQVYLRDGFVPPFTTDEIYANLEFEDQAAVFFLQLKDKA